MGDKDLENIIDSIGQEELEVAQKQAQIDRLKQLIVKQKKEMEEQQKLIEELQNRIKNMYDLPADVEALKRMVGEMRAELNEKDSQLEMAYGTIAQQEAQLKNTQMQIDGFNQHLNTYITQVGELKSKLIEQKGIISAKDREIQELKMAHSRTQENLQKMEEEFAQRVQARLRQFMETEDEYKARIEKMEREFEERTQELRNQTLTTKDEYQARIAKLELQFRNENKALQDEMRSLTEQNHDLEMKLARYQTEIAEIDDIKKNYESRIKNMQEELAEIKKLNEERISQLNDEHFKEKSGYVEKIDKLEAEILDYKMQFSELEKRATLAEKRVNDIKSKQDELLDKYEQVTREKDELEAKLNEFKEGNQSLIDFREQNLGKIQNLNGLLKLFEQEPLFKCFLLVKDVGEMNIDLLKGALGLPSITVKKYIDQFIEVGLFEDVGNGKVKLTHPF
ncbi:MAG: hypothetical protein DRO88_07580 [Promethearchaeia archaeon]|nr:MAG: hypothetical protein DRO88_07580 [Candidatus Lokiarchaeia archaeon]